MVSRILLLALPGAAFATGTNLVGTPVSFDSFKTEYNKELAADLTSAVKILTFNKAIRGTSEPTTDADAATLWNWYSTVTGSAKTQATAFLTTVEADNLVHESMLTTFKTKLDSALPQTAGAVAADAKNYGAIVGSTLPTVSTSTGITQAAQDAYTALQSMGTANIAKAKKAAESRVYDAWHLRFKKLITDGRFGGTTGFQNIVSCLKQTLQTTDPGNDSDGGTSGWAVYSRVSAATQAKMKAAIVAQMTASAENVA